MDRNGSNINGIDEIGCNRSKEKIIQAIRENPCNIYYVSEVFRNKYEIMKDCVESDPYTNEYATLHFKQNVDLAIIFLEHGGSFSPISKHLHNNKEVGMIAVKNNPNSFQHVGKSLKDDDDIFKLAFQQNKKNLVMPARDYGKLTFNHKFLVLNLVNNIQNKLFFIK